MASDIMPPEPFKWTVNDMWKLKAMELHQQNATMRALLEETANGDPGEASGPNDDMSCRFCFGWPDWDNIPAGTRSDQLTYQHEPDCYWVRVRAFLAEHPPTK